MKIAIVGAGPAGLMAGHAAARLGHEIDWYDAQGTGAIEAIVAGRVSAGVFLLHHPCDLLPILSRPLIVDYGVYAGSVYGEAESKHLAKLYRDKVYGDEWLGDVSLEHYALYPRREEWDALGALRLIVDMLAPKVQSAVFANVHDIQMDLGDYDRVIATAPAPAIFKDIGNWPSVEVAVHTGDPKDEREAYVWYAPHPNVPWYRASAAFGRFAIEYPVREGGHIGPKDVDVTIVRKPLAQIALTNQQRELERPGHIKFLGRFAQWKKGVENHHVYREATQWLQR